MGLFKRKPDNRVKCPECSGSGISGFHEIKNPQPRPQAPGFRTYGSSDGSVSDYSSYYNYEEKITISDKCTTCNGKGKVDPEVASAYRAPTDYKAFKMSIPKRMSEKVNPADPKSNGPLSSVPVPAPQEVRRGSKANASQSQIDSLIEKCNAEIKVLTEKSDSDRSKYAGLKFWLTKGLEQLSTIQDKNQKSLIDDSNYIFSMFFVEVDSMLKLTPPESKPLLESINHDFNEVMYLKAKQLGMRYAFRDHYDLKVYFLDYWN